MTRACPPGRLREWVDEETQMRVRIVCPREDDSGMVAVTDLLRGCSYARSWAPGETMEHVITQVTKAMVERRKQGAGA